MTASTCRCFAAAPGRSESAGSKELRRAGFGDLEEALAELRCVLAEVIEARKRGKALQAEDALEQRRRPVAPRSTRLATAESAATPRIRATSGREHGPR